MEKPVSDNHTHQSSVNGLCEGLSWSSAEDSKADAPPLLIVEASQTVDDAKGEEEEKRVEQDEAADDEKSEVCAPI